MPTAQRHPTAFRFSAEVRQGLEVLAAREGRSMASLIGWLVRKQCERDGLGWPVPDAKSASTPATQDDAT